MTAEGLNDIARNHFNMGDYTFYKTAASEALGAAQEAGKIHVREDFIRALIPIFSQQEKRGCWRIPSRWKMAG